MGKTIIIAEKSSVAEDYKRILKVQENGTETKGYFDGYSRELNREVLITWSQGHLITMKQPEDLNEDWQGIWRREQLPMIPEQFKYEVIEKSKARFNVVKSLYTRNDIDCIYYAGDSAREGVYIQALIRNQIFKRKPNFQELIVWSPDNSEKGVLQAFREAKPYNAYLPMIESGYMRAISDWLIGMNFTRCFTVTSGAKINVGRVMTPTLAMIVRRQIEIETFKKTDYFGVKADNFATWKAVEGTRFFENPLLYNETGFKNRGDAERLVEIFNRAKKLMVDNVEVKEKTEFAPYLFNLTDLQAACSKKFHITPTQTLEIAQRLYEAKITSYPRTSCRFLSSKLCEELAQKGMYIPPRYINDKEVIEHYAIIPTYNDEGNPDELTGLDKSVYELILKRFTDTMLPPFVYDAVSVTYIHPSREKFFESWRIVKQMGFKGNNNDNDEDNNDENDVTANKPIPQKGSVIDVNNFVVTNMETKPPVPYTTGTIIQVMEKAGRLIEDEELREQFKTSGIGTPATRDSIITKLNKEGFITIDKKQKIAPTKLSMQIIPVIAQYDKALVSPDRTAAMENALNAIVTGEMTSGEYLSRIKQYISSTTKRVLEENKAQVGEPKIETSGREYPCPCCKNTLKFGKYGWYCSEEDCGFSFRIDNNGHQMTEEDLADLLEKGRTKSYVFRSKPKAVEGKKKKVSRQYKAHLVVDMEKKRTSFVMDKDWD